MVYTPETLLPQDTGRVFKTFEFFGELREVKSRIYKIKPTPDGTTFQEIEMVTLPITDECVTVIGITRKGEIVASTMPGSNSSRKTFTLCESSLFKAEGTIIEMHFYGSVYPKNRIVDIYKLGYENTLNPTIATPELYLSAGSMEKILTVFGARTLQIKRLLGLDN